VSQPASSAQPGRLARTASAARASWHATVDRAVGLTAGVRQIWRQSLQFRMVTLTLVTAGLLVGAFGYLVAQRSAGILIDGAVDDVQAEVDTAAEYASGQLSVHSQAQDPEIPRTLTSTVSYLAGSPEQVAGVVVVFKSYNEPAIPTVTSAAVDMTLISPELESSVASAKQLAWQIRTGETDQRGLVKYLVYGSPVPTNFGQVELYYLVPLTSQDEIAGQIQATVLLTGVALVVLLAVLANLVTRLVVNPVRMAARTAQRLSAGLLDQRMAVQGEDDLAQLAAAFNQMATNLQRQIQRLEEMSRLQRRFTSDVSHELRTPLTTVRMAADLIFNHRADFEPAVARSAELLQTELDRFESLLTDLLEISRFDAGFAVLDAEPTDVVPLVRRVSDGLEAVADRAGVPLCVHLPDRPVIAEIDPRRVERILRNLVGNAVEHAEGRPVDVVLAADDLAVAIAVRDRGVGLRPGEEKLVFNRFWRADPSRARQTGGTGLGLSISVEDARLHGGWLEAWGEHGQGAQFRLTLPLRAGDRLISSPLKLAPADDLLVDPATADPGTTTGPVAGGRTAGLVRAAFTGPAALIGPAALTAPVAPPAITGPEPLLAVTGPAVVSGPVETRDASEPGGDPPVVAAGAGRSSAGSRARPEAGGTPRSSATGPARPAAAGAGRPAAGGDTGAEAGT
jgi:two-component system, OmpR family, sensor histidine kinase MtrB